MSMISFYPGPSRVYDGIPGYTKDAFEAGLLGMNHRSSEFINLYKETTRMLKKKLSIPVGYKIYFVSSATESWEIIAQSLIRNSSTHIYNGAFGKKWYAYTSRISNNKTTKIEFDKEETFNPTSVIKNEELICITQNETSNGTQVSDKIISTIRKNNPRAIIAVDATSSMAGKFLKFSDADVWFASAQKCFGLPAGLCIMICSPNAITRAKAIGERKHYNSLLFMDDMSDINQTTHTPNVLGIYLLNRILKKVEAIKDVSKRIEATANTWYSFFDNHSFLKPLINNNLVRSSTVICITGKPNQIISIKKKARSVGFVLGDGYGDLKETTFRIANFPAIKSTEVKALMSFLKSIK